MAKVLHKDIGDLWSEPVATFTVGGTPTDPTNLTVRQQKPDGTETVIVNNVLVSTLNASSTPIKKTGTGVFQPNPGITLDTSGHWYIRYEGTGTVTASVEWEAVVDPSQFTNNAGLSARALVSLEEARDWLNQNTQTVVENAELVRVINDVSARFHDEAEREFKVIGTNPQTRSFFVDTVANRCWVIPVGDMAAAPAQVQIVGLDWTTVLATISSTDIICEPEIRNEWDPIRQLRLNSMHVLRPLRGYRVKVTGNFGFPAVPGNVRDAVLEAVAEVLDRPVEHYSQSLTPSTTGGTTNVIVTSKTHAELLRLPARPLAVARRYLDPLVG